VKQNRAKEEKEIPPIPGFEVDSFINVYATNNDNFCSKKHSIYLTAMWRLGL